MANFFSRLFGSGNKPNLTPDVQQPDQNNLYYTNQLRQNTQDRLNGQNLGFGPDFLSKTTNPAIAGIEANFQNKTVPFMASQLASRGISRSVGPNLASDTMMQAENQKNRDIANLQSQFYLLDQQQRKADYGQALGEANTMQGQQADMLTNKANASERLANATAAQTNYNNQLQKQGAQSILQGSAYALPSVGGAFSSIGGALSGVPGLGPIGGMLSGEGNAIGGVKIPGYTAPTLQSQEQVDLLRKILSGGQ